MRGGKRPGAGRKRGSHNKRNAEITDRIVADGITPLEVMLRTMREAWDKGDKPAACAAAKDAAPYVHARLIAQDNKADLSEHYVARAPSVAASEEEWQATYTPTIQ